MAVNWLVKSQYQQVRSKTDAHDTAPQQLPSALMKLAQEDGMARRMVERMQRNEMETAIIANAGQHPIINPPSAAQLSRLRNLIADMLFKKETSDQRLVDALKSIQERKTTAQKFERARVGTQPLLKWIESVLGKTAWTLQWESSRPEQILEYRLRLIDAVLARAIKDIQKKEREGTPNG